MSHRSAGSGTRSPSTRPNPSTRPSLSEEQKAEVQRLRDEGQRLHSEGQHDEAMETLAQAEEMLGI